MRLEVTRAAVPSGDGLILIDKPGGVTSHDVVSAMRRLGGTRKVGHAGTLDPLATGVLVVALGRATRLLQYLTAEYKAYRAEIILGVSTDTDDREGQVIDWRGASLRQDGGPAVSLTQTEIERAMSLMTGQIKQVPARVSAVKIGGKRAHVLHREGQSVKLAARPVQVNTFAMLGKARPVALRVQPGGQLQVALGGGDDTVAGLSFEAEVKCSAGTYVRCLARDLGQTLGCGGIVSELRRTAVGEWEAEQCWQIADLNRLVEGGKSLPLVSLEQLCAQIFPVREVDQRCAQSLLYGNAQGIDWPGEPGQRYVAFHRGSAVAVLERQHSGWRPRVVFGSVGSIAEK